jgi:hypothetical protein
MRDAAQREGLPAPGKLKCSECGKDSDEKATGWRAFRTCDEPAEVVAFCPACGLREFGHD